jgi:tetratricopeptide (TPR) repeat protein
MAQATWHALKCDAVRWRRLKRPAQAIACLAQAVEMTQQSPDLSRETGSLLNYLADLYLQEGHLAQAEAAIRRALQINLSIPGPERGLAADDLMILAKVLSSQARHREAYEVGSQALASFRQQLGTRGEFIARIENMVEELRTKREKEGDDELKSSRVEPAAAADRGRDSGPSGHGDSFPGPGG